MRAVVFAALLITAGPVSAGPGAPVDDAERWLALVDAGRYAESWSAAGTVFRQRMAKDAWTGMVEPVRKPLGALLTRTVLAETRTKSLPGAPDGDYEIIQFSTAFAGKKAAVETVALTHEPDGWRVDGYFVR